ncbi:MAG: D-tyrosyl-tRNA(Tyr) deacylase [bacterium]|jgi:D-tyrosyl-tRNA(Tyr) deacylase
MKVIVQRVNCAILTAEGGRTTSIGKGYFVLAGVAEGDVPEDALYLADKIAKLRIFEDESGKMNLSISEVNGQVLVVSQFTLFANTRRGNRPSFAGYAPPEEAEPLLVMMIEELRARGIETASGVFGAHMKIAADCDGPVTIIIDSSDRHVPRRQA